MVMGEMWGIIKGAGYSSWGRKLGKEPIEH